VDDLGVGHFVLDLGDQLAHLPYFGSPKSLRVQRVGVAVVLTESACDLHHVVANTPLRKVGGASPSNTHAGARMVEKASNQG
jgi:hypothetical protein